MRQRNSFLHVMGAETLAHHGVNCVLRDMLPDNMCKCKTKCTFIRSVHRSPYRRTGGQQTVETYSDTYSPLAHSKLQRVIFAGKNAFETVGRGYGWSRCTTACLQVNSATFAGRRASTATPTGRASSWPRCRAARSPCGTRVSRLVLSCSTLRRRSPHSWQVPRMASLTTYCAKRSNLPASSTAHCSPLGDTSITDRQS